MSDQVRGFGGQRSETWAGGSTGSPYTASSLAVMTASVFLMRGHSSVLPLCSQKQLRFHYVQQWMT